MGGRSFDCNDFDCPPDRRGTDSLKWDVADGELPLWVADMDFATAPAVRDAILDRARHGVFGYATVPDAWQEAYVQWWETRHGFRMESDWLIFCTGVVPAISSVVRKITTPNENVLLLTPVYNIFFNSIRNNGCRPLECPLLYEPDSSEPYRIDFDALEAGLADPQTTLMLLCNPHNPTGTIWSRETLARIGSLCRKYRVTVLSDEIHCDLTDPDCAYVPFASVSDCCREISITCLSPSKAFNLAGLQSAAVSVPDPGLRHKVWRALNTDEVAEPNVFAVPAAVAAFRHGASWLDALRAYIAENKRIARQFLAEHVPQIRPVPAHATYLLWLDARALTPERASGAASGPTSGAALGPASGAASGAALDPALGLADFLRRETGLYLSAGEQYGAGGEGFLRMNAACSRRTLEDALRRLADGVALLTR